MRLIVIVLLLSLMVSYVTFGPIPELIVTTVLETAAAEYPTEDEEIPFAGNYDYVMPGNSDWQAQTNREEEPIRISQQTIRYFKNGKEIKGTTTNEEGSMTTEAYWIIAGLVLLSVLASYWKGRHDEGRERDIQIRNEENTRRWEAHFDNIRKSSGSYNS